jgi:hypothetical protein
LYSTKTLFPLIFVTFVLGFPLISCSGTGPETKTYSVTIASLTNGSITANPTNGTEGTEITLTIIPDGDYKLKAGTLKYGTTSIDEITKKFNLPAEDVIITAQFEQKTPTENLIGYWTQTSPSTNYALEFKGNNTLDTIMGGSVLGNMSFTYVGTTLTIDTQIAMCVFSNNYTTLTISGLTDGASPFNGVYNKN